MKAMNRYYQRVMHSQVGDVLNGAPVGYMGSMFDHDTLVEIRRENLRAIANEKGGITALANLIGKSQGQLSHLIGKAPSKPIGEKIAREIEQKIGLERLWLDRPHGINEKLLDLVMEELDNNIPKNYQLTPEKRRRMIALFYALIAENGVRREKIREIIALLR